MPEVCNETQAEWEDAMLVYLFKKIHLKLGLPSQLKLWRAEWQNLSLMDFFLCILRKFSKTLGKYI